MVVGARRSVDLICSLPSGLDVRLASSIHLRSVCPVRASPCAAARPPAPRIACAAAPAGSACSRTRPSSSRGTCEPPRGCRPPCTAPRTRLFEFRPYWTVFVRISSNSANVVIAAGARTTSKQYENKKLSRPRCDRKLGLVAGGVSSDAMGVAPLPEREAQKERAKSCRSFSLKYFFGVDVWF